MSLTKQQEERVRGIVRLTLEEVRPGIVTMIGFAIAAHTATFADNANTATNALQLGGVAAAGYSTTQAVETARINAIATNRVANATFADSASYATNAGAVIEAVTAKITTYTILAADSFLTGSGSFTFTLPTAVGRIGKAYTIKNIGTGVITIACSGAETTDGDATYVIRTTNSGGTIISDGSNWLVKGVF